MEEVQSPEVWSPRYRNGKNALVEIKGVESEVCPTAVITQDSMDIIEMVQTARSLKDGGATPLEAGLLALDENLRPIPGAVPAAVEEAFSILASERNRADNAIYESERQRGNSR